MDETTPVPADAGAATMLGCGPPDWAAIKEGYERGFDPIVTIAKQQGVTYRQIYAQAYRHKWRRLAMEGAGANAVEVSVGAMTRDLQRALQRQIRGLELNMRKELARKKATAASKLDTINAAIRGLIGATGVVEKVLKINARNAERVEHLRTKDGGDDPKAEFERRLAGYVVAARKGRLPEPADAG